MAVLDIDGLLNGKRLRKCSDGARIYFHFYYLLSNNYARIELDYEDIAEHFFSFENPLTAEHVKGHFQEYIANHLIFAYSSGNRQWGQWDTERSRTKNYKTSKDKKTPHPPEAEYQAWLKEQHGDDWGRFHWSSSPILVSQQNQPLKKISEDLENSRKISEDFCLGVGVGVGVGEGKNKSARSVPDSMDDFTPDDLAPELLRQMGIGATAGTKNAAVQSLVIKGKQPGWNVPKALKHIVQRWGEFKLSPRYKSPVKPKAENWLIEGDYDNRESWQLLSGKSPPSGTVSPVALGVAEDASAEAAARRRLREQNTKINGNKN